jgi:outer membrane protein TolC
LRDIPRDRFSLLPQDAGSTRYLFKQTLPFAGKRLLERRIAGSEADRAAALRDGARRSLHQRIRENYARYWYAGRALERLGDLESQLATLEALAQARYRGGLGSQQDVLKANIERTQALRQRLQLETQQNQAIAQLNAALGRPAEAALDAPQLAPPQASFANLGALQRQLLDTHPMLQAEAAAVAAANLASQRVRRNRLPDLVLGVAPIQSGSALESWDVMLGFTLPLQRGRRHAEERAADLTARAAVARRDAAAAQLGGTLADSWAQRQSALRQLALLRDTLLPIATANCQAAQAAYRLGRVDLGAVFDALRQTNELQQDLLAAQLELRLRTLDIEALSGENS